MDKIFRRELNEPLTNEALNLRFKSTFDLVSYAIVLANEMVASGHVAQTSLGDDLNVANVVLETIADGRDRLSLLQDEEEEDEDDDDDDEMLNGHDHEDS